MLDYKLSEYIEKRIQHYGMINYHVNEELKPLRKNKLK